MTLAMTATTDTVTTADTLAPEASFADVQGACAAIYQQSLARAGGDPRGVDAAGREALATLIASIEPLLHSIASRKMLARFGRLDGDTLQDAVSEMTVAVIEAAAKFDPARCPSFHAWVTGEQGSARAALYSSLDFAKRADGWEDRDRRALAIAARSRTVLRDRLGREPSLPELQEHMREYCFDYQLARQSAEEQTKPADARREAARKKLVNAGMLARINDIGPMLEVARAAVTPDDAEIGWDVLGVTAASQETGHGALEAVEAHLDAADLLQVAFAGLTQNEREIVATRLGVVEGRPSTLAAVAAQFGVTAAQVRELAASAACRVQAAHAHYALLAPGVLSQFESMPADEALPSGVRLV